MGRAADNRKAEAERLFREGMLLVEISKKIGVPEGTIRSWKSRGRWDEAGSKKNECNVAKENEEANATLQKRKRGAPRGNQNAKGAKGGAAPLGNRNAQKHGAYSKIYWDTLDDDELELLQGIPSGEEYGLNQQIAMYTIRERRLNQQIRDFKKAAKKGLYVKGVKKKKHAVYDDDGKLIDEYEDISTDTENAIKGIIALESELTKVQRAKTKCIDSLIHLRIANERHDDLLNGWQSKMAVESAEESEEVVEVQIYIPHNGRDEI